MASVRLRKGLTEPILIGTDCTQQTLVYENLKTRKEFNGIRDKSVSKKSIDSGVSTVDSVKGLKALLLNKMNLLLVCCPLGMMAEPVFHWSQDATFWFNFLAMIPLANLLGDATEELAANLRNDTLSGLLNATFGNAVEMIMTIALLKDGQFMVVKSSLIGSILSNMLLVLGMSFFFGGLSRNSTSSSENLKEPLVPYNKEQKFSQTGSLASAATLLLSASLFSLVTVFNFIDNIPSSDRLSEERLYMRPISISCSILMMMSYAAFIIFQMFTHERLLAEGDGGENEGDDEEAASISLSVSLGLLLVVTIVVAVCSELLTGSLDNMLVSTGLSKAFVGVVLIPIIGNACEHVSAIRFAVVDKPGLAVGIAIGSSVQISVFVMPFAVLVGAILGCEKDGEIMDLDFGALNVTVLLLSVLIVSAIVVDGRSNWFEGWLLMTAYAVIAILFFFDPE